MKKIFSLLVMFLALSCMHVSAQNGANRMIVVNKDGSKSGHIIESLDSIFFAKTPGTASVSLTAGSIVDDDLLYPMVRATIKKEGLCQSFRYTVVPKSEADAMVSDADVINYFNTFASKSYTEDINDQILKNVNLSRGITNTILAVAYDEYNIACSASKADFEIPGDFKITIADVNYISITADITPRDETMAYLVNIAEDEYGISDRDLYEKDKAFYKEQFDQGISSLEFFIKRDTIVGKANRGFFTSSAVSDYIIYAYGVDIRTGEPTTGITRVPVHNPDFEKTDVKFDLTANVTDGTNLEISCKPLNYDGYYDFDIMDLDIFDVDDISNIDEIKEKLELDWKRTLITYQSYGYDMEQILESICYKGDKTLSDIEIRANKPYALWACAVNNDGVITTPDYSLVYFKSGKAPITSENIITLNVEEINPYFAEINFKGTVSGESMAVYSGSAKEFEGLEGDAILQYIVDRSYYPEVITTNTSRVCGPFLPNSKARVYAYGIEQYSYTQNPTTDLVGIEFETPEVVCDETLTGRLSYDKYYDYEAVAKLDKSYEKLATAGYAFLPAELTHSENARLYTAFFTDKEIKGKTDEEISLMILKDYTNTNESGKDYRIFKFPYGTEVTGFSLELRYDYKTVGKLYRGDKIKIDRAYLSIPQEFVDNYTAPVKTSPAQVKGSTSKKSENLIKAAPAKIVKRSLGAADAGRNKFPNR